MAEQEQEQQEEQSAGDAADKHKEESEAAKQEIKDLEKDPPQRLEDWPGGKAKYQTFGGADSETDYEEGPTSKLGPSNLRRFEDGSITIDGEQVDNPDDYKGEPIPGGPTDPNAPVEPGEEGHDDDDR